MASGEEQPKPPQNAETVEMRPVTAPPALPERYQLMGELGRGGMGIVYQARDRETNEIIALKFLKSEIAGDARILERFRNEVRLSRKISHRNVARIHEFHRSGDSVYVSMEFVEGESLRAVLQREGKLPVERGLDIARQLIAGVGEAHKESIVHRDLKPENIMVKPSGEVKVMDFGISRSYAAGVTATGAIIGTPAYMAPEQAEGKPTDQRTDIYALGLILYEMFTGTAAFSGETPVSVALKQIRERPPAPSRIAPGLPGYLEKTILRCLEKDPAQRFQSVDELLGALNQEARPVSRPAARSKKSWWIAAAALVAVAGVAAFWMLRPRSDTLRFSLERFTLANGLPVVLSVDHSAPVFTFLVSYKAGTRTDPVGKSGLALMVDHVMQQGSENLGPDELESLISQFGGNHTYGIYQDSSYFADTLPSSQLEMALFMEADRMRSLQIAPAGMDSVRSYVKEQYAETASRPYGRALNRMVHLTFSNVVNQRGFAGPPEEIDSISIDDAKDFYKKYYMPSNAALILVGDFDPQKARERIKHYFENIPSAPAPPQPDSSEPPLTAERRESITDPTANVPIVLLCWPVASASNSKDWFALKALGDVLWGTEAARLPMMARGAGIASGVEGSLGTSGGPNYFWIALIAVPGKDLGQLEKMALQEIERIAREGVPADEMERIRMNGLRSRAMEFVTSVNRAIVMGQLKSLGFDPEALNGWEEDEKRLTGDELRRVAKQYLTANKAVVVVNPEASK